MGAYVQEMIDRSEFNPRGIPVANDIKQSFAFATCDNTYLSTGRYVLFCYVVDKNAEELSGNIGISEDVSGNASGFVNDLEQDEANELEQTTQEEG